MESLSVTYRSGATYLLPTTTPSTPGLTPNASSTSSYSLSSSPSSLSYAASNLGIPESPPAASTRGEECDSPSKPVISRASSRPSLRHMPSWRSFRSHVSLRSRGSVDVAGKEEDGDSGSQSSDEEGYNQGQDDLTPIKERFTPRGRIGSVAGRQVDSAKTRHGGNGHALGFARALKKLSLGSLGRHVEQARQRGSIPRQMRDGPGGGDTLSPIPLSPQSSGSEIELEGEYFTPPTISTAVLRSFPALPSHGTLPRAALRPKQWTGGITPTPNHTPARERPDAVSRAVREAPEVGEDDPFDTDIFSPRVSQAPVLRGIIDSLPISPLELPSSRIIRPSSTLAVRDFPTPVLPRNTAPSPIVSVEPTSAMPSLGQVASTLRHTSSLTRPRSTMAPGYRLPRASIPSSSTTPSLFPASYTHSTLPFTRRHFCIIRPPTLPSPTPPSLIASPRSLGTPLIPPGPTSPSRLDTLAGKPPQGFLVEAIPDVLAETRARRTSAAIRAGAISPSSGLGFGTMTQAGSGFRKGSNGGSSQGRRVSAGHRLPTPGTFGLEGEAEQRLVQEGVNPYFA